MPDNHLGRYRLNTILPNGDVLHNSLQEPMLTVHLKTGLSTEVTGATIRIIPLSDLHILHQLSGPAVLLIALPPEALQAVAEEEVLQDHQEAVIKI